MDLKHKLLHIIRRRERITPAVSPGVSGRAARDATAHLRPSIRRVSHVLGVNERTVRKWYDTGNMPLDALVEYAHRSGLDPHDFYVVARSVTAIKGEWKPKAPWTRANAAYPKDKAPQSTAPAKAKRQRGGRVQRKPR